MCRKDPGPRCSGCASDKLNGAQQRLTKHKAELAAYEEKYAETLTVPDEEKTKKDWVKERKYERLLNKQETLQDEVNQNQFIFNTTQVGQNELQKQIDAARSNGDEAKLAELEATLEKAKEHHEWQLNTARKLKKTADVHGDDAAVDEAEEIFKEAQAEEKTVEEKIEDINDQLEDLQAEEAEYEQQEEDHANGTNVLSEEELKKIRAKHRRRVVLIASLIGAVVVYGLIKEAATGRQSQMFGFLKNMAHKQTANKALHVFETLFSGKASYINERRAQKENEQENQAAEEKTKRSEKEKQKILDKAQATLEKAKHDPKEWDNLDTEVLPAQEEQREHTPA